MERTFAKRPHWWALAVLAVLVPVLVVGQASHGAVGAAEPMARLVPKPALARPSGGTFSIPRTAHVVVRPAQPAALAAARFLARLLDRSPGYHIAVTPTGAVGAGDIELVLAASSGLGAEGYRLSISRDRAALTATDPAGLFWGAQTIRQLLPARIERTNAGAGTWALPTGLIRDAPRFAWRGAMLDVSRHFFGVRTVERFIDAMAAYKLNRLHLHLSDDQGWRIAIRSWPRLATVGGRGGYYTQAQYRALVAYAGARHITLVPEIDMPGHMTAALSSYAALNCDGVAPSLQTGIGPGHALCLSRPETYRFVTDVVREVAALTPGPYFHVGGDEAAVPSADYARFVDRVSEIVAARGKRLVGWEEISGGQLPKGALAQHWGTAALARRAAAEGARLIMSPATKAYLDMKYDASTPIGTTWAGYTSVRDAYDWDPATQVAGVRASAIAGVEAPLWTESVATERQLDYMAFPRLIGIAEIGWSPRSGRSWNEYRYRLAAQWPRLVAMGVRPYRAPGVPWG